MANYLQWIVVAPIALGWLAAIVCGVYAVFATFFGKD